MCCNGTVGLVGSVRDVVALGCPVLTEVHRLFRPCPTVHLVWFGLVLLARAGRWGTHAHGTVPYCTVRGRGVSTLRFGVAGMVMLGGLFMRVGLGHTVLGLLSSQG